MDAADQSIAAFKEKFLPNVLYMFNTGVARRPRSTSKKYEFGVSLGFKNV